MRDSVLELLGKDEKALDSMEIANNSELAPTNIFPADSDLSLCNNTTAINNTDIIINTTSMFFPPVNISIILHFT